MKVNEWKRIYHPNNKRKAIKEGKKKSSGYVNIKVEFGAKRITRDREGHHAVTERVKPPRKHSHPKCVPQRTAEYVKLKTDVT